LSGPGCWIRRFVSSFRIAAGLGAGGDPDVRPPRRRPYAAAQPREKVGSRPFDASASSRVMGSIPISAQVDARAEDQAYDATARRRLWDLSAELTGESAEV